MPDVAIVDGPGYSAPDVCGICGVVQVGGDPREVLSQARLDVMTDAMAHRGPNDRGAFTAAGIALGVRRLSIVDVEGGHQPFVSEDGRIVAIQNGELYNHEELRRELSRAGHEFRSHCDTEIIPHLYERDGLRFAQLVRGKFAIAVWDGHRRRAVLARDRLGVKPLYWTRVDDLVVFASELKALLASGLVDAELDYEAIDLYLSLGFVPGPRTVLAGVRKLAPGGLLEIADGDVRESLFWEYPHPEPEHPARTISEYAEELLELLRLAVRDRLMSDVPIGAMLSGGLDSSLIVALMAEASTGPTVTFSVGFREDHANELADARHIARALGCEHHELELSVTEPTLDLDEFVWHLDEPVADLSALGFDLLSRLASEYVTVALSGQGADELFGGYRKHRVASTLRLLDGIPGAARRGLARLPWPHRGLQRAVRALAADDPSERLLAVSGRLLGKSRTELYRGRLAAIPESFVHSELEAFRGSVNGDPLSSMLYLDARLGLVDDMLLYFDRTSMAHSLEVRVPYLDHRIVEWAARLPPSMKVRGGITKRVLREVGSTLLPSETVHKRKIGFFRFALGTWLGAQLEETAGERLRDPRAAYRELLDGTEVESLLRRYRSAPAEDEARVLFAILVLESWLTSFRARADALSRTAVPHASGGLRRTP
ncbi:MAG: amidotransferase 1, exosortase A system-associated [Gaiellaceae bacterium]|nr:MAG: amidotransferase 1, exosortase A system-associated [Gaiellaceae bacterium]